MPRAGSTRVRRYSLEFKHHIVATDTEVVMKLARIGLVAPCGVVSALVAFVLVAALEQVGIAQVNPALLGEWKLNLAKSTFTPGPPPTTETRI